ncbi:MAG: hypothetical protein BGO90_03795 [Legionella sp. 40-6]|nr:DUF190 domain-containing protein [Legionella sp.]OJY18645.1 MAG: hypothetical protein BGO90_03795 [Legionella sp. 40-6]
MKTIEVIFVRVYIMESSHLLSKILEHLRQEVKIRGVSVFRAIKGYGEEHAHTSSFLDLSLDLPLAVEFFDIPEKVDTALEHLYSFIKPEHIVFWHAKTNV